MSQENVELLRRLFELFSGREVDVNAVLELVGPDVVWEVRSDFPDAAIYTGHEGFRRLHAAFDEVVDETRPSPHARRRGYSPCATAGSARSGNTPPRTRPSKPPG